MRKLFNIPLIKNAIYSKIFMLVLVGLTLVYFPVAAQNDKLAPRMSLVSTQINSDTILLQTSLKVKQEGWQPVAFESVSFFNQTELERKPLGEAITNEKGIASLKVGVKQLFKGEDGLWSFNSSFSGTNSINDDEAELTIRPAGILMNGQKQDSTLSITMRLFEPSEDQAPLADIDVTFYVKRSFGNLKIGEGTTDENGEVSIECPGNLRSINQGNLVLIGRAEDLDEYSTVEASIERPWGLPISDVVKIDRELWTHAPPLWMVIVFALLMTLVWGHYFFIIYKLFKLRNQYH